MEDELRWNSDCIVYWVNKRNIRSKINDYNQILGIYFVLQGRNKDQDILMRFE